MSVVTNTPILPYHDPEDAAQWLCDAYGFSLDRVVRDGGGEPSYISLKLGQNFVLVSPSSSPLLAEFGVQPNGEGQRATQTCYVYADDVEAHCAKARSAGAEIALSPEADEDGAKFYVSRDPGGHVWIFGTRQFVEAQPARKTSWPTWAAGAVAGGCVALLASVAWLNPAGVTDRAATVFSLNTGEAGRLSDRARELINAERQQRAAAERLAKEERDRRVSAEGSARQEKDRRLAAERRIKEESDKRASAEQLLADERRKRAAAEYLAAEAENKRTADAQGIEKMRDKRIVAERLAAEERAKRVAAERVAAEEREKRAAAERLAAEAQDKRAAAERLAARVEDKRAAAERLAGEAAKKRADAERALQLASEQFARATAEQARLRASLAQMSGTNARNRQRASSQRRLRLATIISLRSSARALQIKLSQKANALAALSGEQSKVRAALEEVRARLGTAQSTISRTTQALAQERIAHTKLEARLDRARKEVASLKAENARLDDELAHAKAALTTAAKQDAPEKPPAEAAGRGTVKVSVVPPPPEKNTRKTVRRDDKRETPEKPEQTAAAQGPSAAILDTKCKRVAWSRLFEKRSGTLEWKLKTLRQLCLRAEASDGPVRCIGLMMRSRLAGVSPSLMRPRLSIESMVLLCGGTHNPRKTVRCYFKRRAARQSAPVAIDRCQDYSAIFRRLEPAG